MRGICIYFFKDWVSLGCEYFQNLLQQQDLHETVPVLYIYHIFVYNIYIYIMYLYILYIIVMQKYVHTYIKMYFHVK